VDPAEQRVARNRPLRTTPFGPRIDIQAIIFEDFQAALDRSFGQPAPITAAAPRLDAPRSIYTSG
jgi:hypothetical protein